MWSLKATTICWVAVCCASIDLPPGFPKCKRSDPNFEECFKSAFNAALPLLKEGLPGIKKTSFFPVQIGSMSIEEGSGPVKVTQHYHETELWNVENLRAKNVKATVTDDEFKIFMEVFLDDYILKANYDFDGFVLFLPMVGSGPCMLRQRNATGTFDIIGNFIEKDGEKYVEVNTFNVSFLPQLLEVEFQNLFNGDEVLGREMNHIMNENWQAIFHDVRHDYDEACAQAFKRDINLIFKKIPYNSLFPM